MDIISTTNNPTIFSLKDTPLVQKAKEFFKLLRTVVFLNIDYLKISMVITPLYHLWLRKVQQAKVMLIKI
jgi:hypothetical protein